MSKFAQIYGFWPPEAATMNIFRWNLACQHRPHVNCLMPNLAWISKAALLQDTQKCKNLVKIAIFYQIFRQSDATKHMLRCYTSISVDMVRGFGMPPVLQRLSDAYGF